MPLSFRLESGILLQSSDVHVILLVHMIYIVQDHRGIFLNGAGGSWHSATARGIAKTRA